MRRIFLITAWLLACLSCCAQDDNDDKIACYTFPKTTESYMKKMWDGYEISLGPARNGSGRGGDDCTAAIYNAAGKIVFRTRGEGAAVDFVQDEKGMIRWERVGGTYEYTGGVDRPYAERAYRVKAGNC